MNIQKSLLASVALLSFAACSGNNPVTLTPRSVPTSTPTPGAVPTATPTPISTTTQFTQIERLARPAIKEAFESFQHHRESNAVEPYNDPTMKTDIRTTEDAIRPANKTLKTDYGALLQAVLIPDEYLVNLNGTAPSGADPYYFLSSEVTSGAAFGGRAPNDDVIGLELSILFGGTLPALGLQPEDNEENNCLQTQNLTDGADSGKNSTATFPYLPNPR